MKYLLLSALLIGGCATTNTPTMQDAIDIQMPRDVEKEQQNRIQDINNELYIYNQIKN